MDMRLLVQSRDKLDAAAAAEFIDSCPNAKVALVYASLKDEVALLEFFQYLVENLKTPFAGTRVSGSATPEGYFEDAVAVAVLCGDFKVDVFSEKIDYKDVEGTADRTLPKIGDAQLCLIHSSNYFQKNAYVDAILRRIQDKKPNMQIWGITASPKPLLATKDGIQENSIAYAAIKGIKYEFRLDSGFQFDEKQDTEHKITKADEYHIYEIDGKDAVEEYSKIQHVRPYLFNTISNLSSRPDVIQMYQIISKLNPVLYDGILKTLIKPLGTDLNGKAAEMLLALHLEEKNRRNITPHAYKTERTILRRLYTTPENQLAVYDRLQENTDGNEKAMLISACAMCPLWFNFNTTALEEKLKKIKHPFLLSYVFGEYGTNLPYKGKEQNLVHGSITATLKLK